MDAHNDNVKQIVQDMLIAEAAANAARASSAMHAAVPGSPEWMTAGAELEFWAIRHDLLCYTPKAWH